MSKNGTPYILHRMEQNTWKARNIMSSLQRLIPWLYIDLYKCYMHAGAH